MTGPWWPCGRRGGRPRPGRPGCRRPGPGRRGALRTASPGWKGAARGPRRPRSAWPGTPRGSARTPASSASVRRSTPLTPRTGSSPSASSRWTPGGRPLPRASTPRAAANCARGAGSPAPWRHRPLTLADIAAHARLSVRTLHRRFRAHTGLSPLQYLLRARLDLARRLLEQEDGATVEDIAARAGFASSASLRRRFRQAAGSTPRAYRAAAR
ncbi:helix-turn-helix domain-containing protein [Streptomyces aureocirculatus]|uniref:helix-turn-helix domain-containing protein n=1 Tax=Streptomyces aureocirculatus TaxID=67275 RepID=UPI001CEC2B2F|nr:helix-turn-helix transcriptional regulator [Streptomyces aureocirculatus]